MTDFWSDDYLIKHRDPAIRWYTIDEKIHIVASDGDMHRSSIDAWADMIRDVIDSVDINEPLFTIVDLSSPDQGFTPYSGDVTRQLLKYITSKRNATTYIGMVLSNNLINQIIFTFFRQILGRTGYPRQAFKKPTDALQWMRENVQAEQSTE